MTTNSIHRTKIVSFPRSGHHLLIRGLQAVFERELVYSEGYGVEHTFQTCPYVNVQKTHDFDLKEPIYPEHYHIIQIRGFTKAVRSWHRLVTLYEEVVERESEFVKGKKEYYDGFVEKWLHRTVPHRMVIDYEYLIHHKAVTIAAVAKHIYVKPLNAYQIAALQAWEKRESFGY